MITSQIVQEKISLKHFDVLNSRLTTMQVSLSDYSFANLYLFREVHDYRVLFVQGGIFVSGVTYDGYRVLLPTRKVEYSDIPVITELLACHDFLFPVPEEWLPVFNSDKFKISFNADDSDYIFTSEKLLTLKGHKLHAKKNLLNQFLKLYSYRAETFSSDRLDDAIRVLDLWQVETGDPKTVTDYHACLDACILAGKFGFSGIIYYVDNVPVGFVLGEERSPTMFTMHFVKGLRSYKGIYPFMYNHFAGNSPVRYQEFNFEQDLGKPTLRAAKSAYQPDRMLPKYRVQLA